MKRQTEGFFCGKNLWLAFIAGNSFNLSSRGEAQRPFFAVRISAWRSVRKQKRKRAEVTVLYGIVEKYVKNLCIRRRWVTREYER